MHSWQRCFHSVEASSDDQRFTFLAKKLFNFVNLIVGPVSWCDQKCIQKVYWGLYAEVSNLTLRSLVSL